MEGTGDLVKNGDGTLILTGANTYSGGTTVTAGTLQGNTGSLQGAIQNNAAVTFNQVESGTYEDIMSGSGSLSKQGDGTLVLTGANAYQGGTMVSAGTLQGDTGSLQGPITNSTSVIFDQGSAGTYAGNMSGAGDLTKNGSGTLTLSGTNSYSGGTTVTAGKLEGDTGSLQGGITNDASVIFDQASTGTYAGVMEGAGDLVKNGDGTLILTGGNTYGGGTTVTAGTLQGSTGSLQGAIQNNAVVNFYQLASGTYGDIMSGRGSLSKQGNGTLTLSGTNSYSGGTTVSEGTLQGNTTSLQGSITNNQNVIFDQGSAGTYAGNMSGAGNLTKNGSGTLTLSGTNSYSGGTTVAAGKLEGDTGSLQGPITNNTSVIFNQGSTGTYAGVMEGAGDLVKNGGGTVILTGGNTYTGGTTVSAGTLQGNTGSLQGDIQNSAAVTFNQVASGTYGDIMSGSGSLSKQGGGTLILTGANTYGGGTTVTDGTLEGNTGSLQGDIQNNSAVTFNQVASGTYEDIISGSGSLSKQGGGILVLTGANTYGGGTTVSEGALQGSTTSLQGPITNDASVIFDQESAGTYAGNMSGAGNLTKNGSGTLTLSGTNSYSGGTTVAAGKLEGDTGSLQGPITNNTSVIFNQGSTGTYVGVMEGAGDLVKNGNGVLILTGGNTYSGGTTVTAGTLQGNTGSLQGPITNGASVIFDQGSTGTYAGVMEGAGDLVKNGDGTLILTGANTYIGGTTVVAGTLEGNTGSLQGPITNGASVIFNQEISGTYAEVIEGAGDLVKNGDGTLIFTGANTYSGGTTVSEGVLQGDTIGLQGDIQNNTSVIFNQGSTGTYAGNMSGIGSLTKNENGTLILSGTNSYSGGTTVSKGVLQGDTTGLQGDIENNAVVAFEQNITGGYAGSMSGMGNLTKDGTGTLTLFGTNSYSGGTTVTAGILQGNATSLQGSITNNAKVIFDQGSTGTYAGNMSGAGNLTKKGTGTLILSGINSYSGGTVVTAGALQGNTGSLKGSITNGASVIFDQGGTGTYAGVIEGSGNLVKSGDGTVIFTGANTYSGGTTVSKGTLQGSTVSLQGPITNNGMVTFDQTTSGIYADTISGKGSLTKTGTGTVTLTGSNTFSGGTTVTDGTLEGNTGSLQGDIQNNAAVVFNQGVSGSYAGVMTGSGSLSKQGDGILILSGKNSYSGGTTVEGGVLQGNTKSLQGPFNNNATVILDQRSTGVFAAPISGSGNVIKKGLGIVILSQENSYTGTTTVNLGVLDITGSIAGSGTTVTKKALLNVKGEVKSPTTTIAHGGTLTGTGELQTVINSGIVWPGNSIGTLTINGDYTQNSNGNLLVEVNSKGASDLLIVTETANLDGRLTLLPHLGIYPAGLQYNFMNYDSRSGTLSLTDVTSLGFSINYHPTFAQLVNANDGAILPVQKRLLSGNARVVADYLFCQNYLPSNPDLLEVMQSLVDVPADQFPEDLVKLSPVQFGALPLVNLQSHRLIADVIVDNTEKFFWCDLCESKENQNKQCRENQNTTSIWVTPVQSYYNQDSIGGETEFDSYLPFDAYSVGVGLGASHLFFDCFHLGGALGYTYSKIDWEKSRGKGHWNSIYVGPSLGWSKKNGYVNLLLLGSYNYYDIHRNIRFPGIKRIANNKHHSYDILARLDGGYKFRVNTGGKLDHFFILPEASVSYFNSIDQGYTESGADSINLKVDSKYSAYLQPTVLVKFLRDFYTPAVCVTPAIQVGWISNVPLSSASHKSKFYKQTTCQPAFTVKSYHKSTNQLTLGGELVFKTNNSWIIELGYKADLLDSSTIQSGKIKLEKQF